MGYSTVAQLSTSKLLKLASYLPPQDFDRFMFYLEDAMIELSSTCRLLNEKIKSISILWQHYYCRHFLTGPYKAKEWDFVYCCARDRFSANDVPIESAKLLDRLDWYDVYRRRIITEHNWRHGYSRTIDISRFDIAYNNLATSWNLNGTAILFPIAFNGSDSDEDEKEYNDYDYGNEEDQRIAIIESGVFAPDMQDNKSSAIPGIHSDPLLSIIDVDNSYSRPKAMLSDRFFISSYVSASSTIVNVYARKSYKLWYTINLPYNSCCVAVSGQWLLVLSNNEPLNKATRLLVYDLENNQKQVKVLDNALHHACIYDATCHSAVIYTAKILNRNNGVIEWTLYQFSNNTSIQQLHRGQFKLNTLINYINILSNEFSYITIDANYGKARLRLCHTVLLNKNKKVQLDQVQKVSSNVMAIKSRYESEYLLYSQVLEEREGELVHSNKLDWSDIIEYRHIIGSCFVIKQRQTINPQYLLVDMSNGEIIRQMDEICQCRMPDFLSVNSLFSYCRTESKIISYGAL
ncbi:hypothetical protein BDF19DRAFT_431457 [Syncephalis fuscata]|nr:hypothetical protein BDF19DRAFT_431457 [Syncephalis fuscata]